MLTIGGQNAFNYVSFVVAILTLVVNVNNNINNNNNNLNQVGQHLEITLNLLVWSGNRTKESP